MIPKNIKTLKESKPYLLKNKNPHSLPSHLWKPQLSVWLPDLSMGVKYEVPKTTSRCLHLSTTTQNSVRSPGRSTLKPPCKQRGLWILINFRKIDKAQWQGDSLWIIWSSHLSFHKVNKHFQVLNHRKVIEVIKLVRRLLTSIKQCIMTKSNRIRMFYLSHLQSM